MTDLTAHGIMGRGVVGTPLWGFQMFAHLSRVRTTAGIAIFLLVTLGLSVTSAGSASAVPTASYTFAPTAPTVHEPVTFTSTSECDVPPCRVQWRYFQSGGSSLGTSMGEGDEITYTFPEAGAYQVSMKITNATSTHGSATASHVVRVQGTFEDADRHLTYSSWRGVSDAAASGGGYRAASSLSASATYSFTGTGATLVSRTGPDLGIAAVSVDGVERLVDLYSPESGSHAETFGELADGEHKIRIEPTGTKNLDSTGTSVTLDELVVGETHTDDSSTEIFYGSWRGSQVAEASGGTVRVTWRAGAASFLTFYGPSVTWLTRTGPAEGMVEVLIDGEQKAILDGYDGTTTWQVPHTFTGLSEGQHTIRVRALGLQNPLSAGTRVTSDAFVVG